MEAEYRICGNKSHPKHSGNLYPKKKVPVEKFIDPQTNRQYQTCFECRKFKNDKLRKNKQILLEKKQELTDPNFSVCLSTSHNKDVSKYPKDKVPKELFYKDNDLKSTEYIYCFDCRKYYTDIKEKNRVVKLEEVSENPEEKFFCYGCDMPRDISEKAIGDDGSELGCCYKCKGRAHVQSKRLYDTAKKMYEGIKKEFIMKNECSCEVCRCIYLKIEDTDYSKPGQKFIQLFTREEKGTNVVDYLGETYNVKDFLVKFENLLELRILEFDHLPEDEQLERGLITPGDEPFKKNKNVSHIVGKYTNGEENLRSETAGCQLADSLCHLRMTIAREKTEKRRNSEKIQYVEDCKKAGCSLCGFCDPELLRFIDMDHLDPATKTGHLSAMARATECSMEMLIKECEGCRPLCRYCHIFFTCWQRANGII